MSNEENKINQSYYVLTKFLQDKHQIFTPNMESHLKAILGAYKKEENNKQKIKKIYKKLIAFDFETDNYKDLDFISEVIQDLKEILEEE